MIGPTLPEAEENVAGTDASLPWVISDQLSTHQIARNKRLKSLVAKTPWLDQWEFEEVGRALVSARNLPLKQKSHRIISSGVKRKLEHGNSAAELDEGSLRQALDRVCVWKTRLDNKLPHAVESSHQLAQLLYRDFASTTTTTSTEEIRLSYSCAILRAINGLADALQQQRSSAQSVAVLTAELGIPGWLVDIRHEATHNQMPKLGVLRLAANTLLEYFDREYWQPQLNAARAPSNDPTRKPTTSSLIQNLLAYEQQQTKTMADRMPDISSSQPRKSSPEKPTKTEPKRFTSVSTTAPDTGSNSSMSDDTDEEMYLDAMTTSPGTFWYPPATSLGTTTNRFAVLQDSSKKKRKTTDKKKKKKPTTPKANKEPSAHHHAKQFVKQGAHNMGLAHQAALLFLVWGGVEGTPAGSGALIPESPVAFPETRNGVQKVRQRYRTLLVVLGKEWPGFLRALMVHLVDFILSLENRTAGSNGAGGTDKYSALDAGSKRKLFFLDSWVRFLVSRDFLAHFYSDLKNNKSKDSSVPAPWSFVEPMRYPLNSLCDRLEASPRHRGFSTSQELATFLIDMLGSHRVKNHGLPDTTNDLDMPLEVATNTLGGSPITKVESPTEQEGDISNAESKPSEKLSLQEIEAMLGDDGPKTENREKSGVATDEVSEGARERENSGTAPPPVVGPFTEAKVEYHVPDEQQVKEPGCSPRLAWVKCTSWEPCAVGALPGYPCTS